MVGVEEDVVVDVVEEVEQVAVTIPTVVVAFPVTPLWPVDHHRPIENDRTVIDHEIEMDEIV